MMENYTVGAGDPCMPERLQVGRSGAFHIWKTLAKRGQTSFP
jgi:hypothetical protein